MFCSQLALLLGSPALWAFRAAVVWLFCPIENKMACLLAGRRNEAGGDRHVQHAKCLAQRASDAPFRFPSEWVLNGFHVFGVSRKIERRLKGS